MAKPLKVIRYEGIPAVAFGPLSDYRALVTEEYSDLAIRTGIRTCRPGYEAKPHWHPYLCRAMSARCNPLMPLAPEDGKLSWITRLVFFLGYAVAGVLLYMAVLMQQGKM